MNVKWPSTGYRSAATFWRTGAYLSATPKILETFPNILRIASTVTGYHVVKEFLWRPWRWKQQIPLKRPTVSYITMCTASNPRKLNFSSRSLGEPSNQRGHFLFLLTTESSIRCSGNYTPSKEHRCSQHNPIKFYNHTPPCHILISFSHTVHVSSSCKIFRQKWHAFRRCRNDWEYHGNPAGTVFPRRFEEGDFLILAKGISVWDSLLFLNIRTSSLF